MGLSTAGTLDELTLRYKLWLDVESKSSLRVATALDPSIMTLEELKRCVAAASPVAGDRRTRVRACAAESSSTASCVCRTHLPTGATMRRSGRRWRSG
jgi:hypothetical protein